MIEDEKMWNHNFRHNFFCISHIKFDSDNYLYEETIPITIKNL